MSTFCPGFSALTASWPPDAAQQLGPLLPGIHVEILPETDSTNTELMRRAHNGQMAPTLLVAQHQTAGHGRMGRSWQSAPEASLTFSLGMAMDAVQLHGLSLAAGVAVVESLQNIAAFCAGSSTKAETLCIGLKWPNDVWLHSPGQECKLAGILVQTRMLHHTPERPPANTATSAYVVVGIGMNIRPAPVDATAQALATPAGYLQSLWPAATPYSALQHLAPAVVAALQQFARQGFGAFQKRFEAMDVLRERTVNLLHNGRLTAQGKACGVNAQGALLVLTPQGMQTVVSSEISVRPQTP